MELNLRTAAQGALIRLANKIEELDYEPDHLEAGQTLNMLQKHYDRFTLNHFALVGKAQREELEAHEELLAHVDEFYSKACVSLQRVQNLNVPKARGELSSSHASDMRLDPVSIPPFDGKPENWLAFKDLFESLVHKRSDLDSAFKLGKLRQYVSASLVPLVGGLYTGGYDEVWTQLKNRYDNPRLLSETHVRRILELPNQPTDTQQSLCHIVDTVRSAFRALAVMGICTTKWDAIMVPILKTKMSLNAASAWGMSLATSEIPALEDLLQFMERRAINMVSDNPRKGTGNMFIKGNVASTATLRICPCCHEQHTLSQCDNFRKLKPPERWELVRKSQGCFNCLRVGHRVLECASRNCLNCDKRHHTLLCTSKQNNQSPEEASHTLNQNSAMVAPVQNHDGSVPPRNFMKSEGNLQSFLVHGEHTVLLATARALVTDRYGEGVPVRILCDPGSQASFMTESCFKSLGLKKQRSDMAVEGIGAAKSTYTRGMATVTLKSIINPEVQIPVKIHLLPVITSTTPSLPIESDSWSHIKTVQLADETFGRPGRVDMLIGADSWAHFIKPGVIHGNTDEPSALNTHLGWVLFGPAKSTESGTSSFSARVQDDDPSLHELIKKFWEAHDPNDTTDDGNNVCEDIYRQTVQRKADGRYSVQILFRPDASALGNSHKLALRQFYQLERRLMSDPELRQQYCDFMKEYEGLGHMERAKGTHEESSEAYFIPHHAVRQKFRVVFNASARTTNNVSLNYFQMSGPPIQDTLVNIISRFRRFRIALAADIKKMFRQIEIDPRHRCWQRILWRENPEDQLGVYELSTVTYGMASSPFNAVRTLQQCADDNHSLIADAARASKAKESILYSFYVDDFLESVDTKEEAVTLAKDVSFILTQGKFELCKWNCNDTATLLSLTGPMAGDMEHDLTSIDQKVLGLIWNPITDELSFKINQNEQAPPATKRNVLSHTARVYDPLGILAPITVRSKIFIQRIWQLGLQWDDALPEDLSAEWQRLYTETLHIRILRIPRWIGMTPKGTVSLHGFCDASRNACAAVVYLQCRNENGEIGVTLVTARTKVSALSQPTIPRLELNAAALLVETLNTVRKALRFQDVASHLYSDSSIVLSWIQKPAHTFKQYVGNRVKHIQDNSDIANWHHISTRLNPADVATRGISPEGLQQHLLWWQGPPFLLDAAYDNTVEAPPPLQEEDMVVTSGESRCLAAILQERTPSRLTTWVEKGVELPLVDRFSNLNRLLRTTAIIFRWRKADLRRQPFISTTEINLALLWHIREAQGIYFKREVDLLRATCSVANRSTLQPLKPYIDTDGVLRVGGRLDNAGIPYDTKHPIILPKEGTFTQLIISEAHTTTLHGGIQLMLRHIRLRFWIIHGRSLVKTYIHRCVACRLHRSTMQRQQMASLPRSRLTVAPPFTHTGLDYCGPFNVRLDGRRTTTTTKTYGVIFVCMTTKAVHIELAEDLSTRAFLDVFDRFVSRRGYCTNLYSDNGTQFVGGNRVLSEDLCQWRADYVQQHIHSMGVNWKFITPAAPHHGGLWEAAVRSAKKHLVRIVGKQPLRHRFLNTLLIRIEACLNSRPLVALHDNPDGRWVLTPGEFLVGRPLLARPEPSLPAAPDNRLKYYQLLQRLQQHFWQHWSNDYLSQQQARSKWTRPEPNLRINDIVAIKHEDLPPTRWRIGRISAVHPGNDGLVRTVTIQYRSGTSEAAGSGTLHEMKRPVQKVCRLVDADEDVLTHNGSAGENVQNS